MNIGTARREAEWNSSQTANDQRRDRWMIGKVRMHVLDSLAAHLLREQHRFREDCDGAQKEVCAAEGSAEDFSQRVQILHWMASQTVPLRAQDGERKIGMKVRTCNPAIGFGMRDLRIRPAKRI